MKPTNIVIDYDEHLFEIDWSDDSKSVHEMYEPSCFMVHEGTVILVGHEEVSMIVAGKQVAYTFTR